MSHNHYLKTYRYFGDLNNPFNLKLLYNDICYLHELKIFNIKLDEQLFMKNLKNKSKKGESVVLSFYETLLETSGKIWLGDKTNRHIPYLEKINEIYPDSKVIHLVRDGRDFALSQIKISSDYNVYLSACRWLKYNKILLRFGEKNKSRYLQIKYEDLINNAEPVIQKVCSFLEIPYSENLLCFTNSDYAKERRFYLKKHNNLKGSILKNNSNKWKIGLSSDEVKIFENIAGSLLKYFRYELLNDYNGVSWRLKKIIYLINKQGWSLIHAYQKIRFIVIILIKRAFKVHRIRD